MRIFLSTHQALWGKLHLVERLRVLYGPRSTMKLAGIEQSRMTSAQTLT